MTHKTKLLSLVLFLIFCYGCQQVADLTPSFSVTSTNEPTIMTTLGITSTETINPSPIPTTTITPTATATPDLMSLGTPANKEKYHYPDWLPSSHFAYDSENYYVYSKVLHGTNVVVAVHKDNDQGEDYHSVFADFVWDTFQLYWEVFQGYPYTEYIVKVLSPSSEQEFVTSTAIGFVVNTNPQKSNIGVSWYKDTEAYRQLVTHEMFHAWNGEIIMDVGNHINYTRPEAWFLEGATHYYGYRGTPNDLNFYAMRFKDSWTRYRGWQKTKYDVPITQMSQYEQTTGEWQYGQNTREKGACLFYLMDKELMANNQSLDDLMRYMYENFGLAGKRYTTTDILTGLNTISGKDWSDFFENYVFGVTPLPLDGKFDYLVH